jgi:hypothetical protein
MKHPIIIIIIIIMILNNSLHRLLFLSSLAAYTVRNARREKVHFDRATSFE